MSRSRVKVGPDLGLFSIQLKSVLDRKRGETIEFEGRFRGGYSCGMNEHRFVALTDTHQHLPLALEMLEHGLNQGRADPSSSVF